MQFLKIETIAHGYVGMVHSNSFFKCKTLAFALITSFNVAFFLELAASKTCLNMPIIYT